MTRPDTPRSDTTAEVRAGPGDAGRQDRPEPLPPARDERRRAAQATRLLVWLVVAGLVVALGLYALR